LCNRLNPSESCCGSTAGWKPAGRGFCRVSGAMGYGIAL